MTATAYGWTCAETGERITQEDIGRLVGFPADYPWRHVGRGRGVQNMAQQSADVVCPMVSAALFGPAVPGAEHRPRERRLTHHQTGPGHPRGRSRACGGRRSPSPLGARTRPPRQPPRRPGCRPISSPSPQGPSPGRGDGASRWSARTAGAS